MAHMVNQMIDFWALRFIHQKQFVLLYLLFFMSSIKYLQDPIT